MEKNLKYGALLDIYSHMLTEKQAQALDFYYNKDYSLAEISELTDITRQGVRDFIKRGETALAEAEAKLGLYKMFQGLDKIRRCAEEIISQRGGKVIDGLAEEIINEADAIRNGEK